MKNFYRYLFPAILISFVFAGCKKDKTPVAQFKVSTDKPNAGDTISFVNSSSNATDYLWNFGDGVTSDLESPTHVYKKPGTFTVTLKAYGTGGSNQTSVDLTVNSPNTIFDGVGIKQVSIGDTWLKVNTLYDFQNAKFNSIYDTVGLYDLLLYLPDKGIYFDFVSNDSVLDNQDLVYSIILVDPFIGSCKKGIYIGSKMSDAISAYGTASYKNTGTNYQGYFYDADGIYFESDTPPYTYVEVIWVYPAQGGIAAKNNPSVLTPERHLQRLKNLLHLKYLK